MISDTIYVMLLTHAKFRQFTSREIVDASKATEVLTALSCPSRARVDEIADAAIAAGGMPNLEPRDYGFMYQRSIRWPYLGVYLDGLRPC